ncbi:cyclic nucleotide-binding domain protein (macronuclear) [Tetrahymena thermophila SB210]|uniref:Cyclic nucleotide-binding domain protein n=1 Tax=Tetrahymena thermophila (strain SB210) TaxID=312017 RepID=Q231J0_TETTS|nr:cyclic nucleotide-binding domain protein [Tetrahymena thermophila SB210]EAR91049.2 cyclic nucleotide-binding domain protein [Tetrahymena thermophila SB210]|eukprot:XP_001011294.2 cyclic nucleotide-binding domain protein [Tetrahymena thermophila SB210]
MILNMNTAYYKRGIQMKKRGKIFQRYVKNEAIFDIIIWVIIQLSYVFDINQLQYVIVLKIFRTMNKIEELFLKYDRQVKYDIILHILLLLLIIITFTHTQASVFVNLALTSSPDEENWINQTQTVSSNLDIYITSIYWSNITMTTIGYGDIYPRNNKEKIFLAIITILSCCIFGYTMNSIGQILADTSKESRQFKIKMNLLVKQMSKRNLDQILQKRVRNYYEYLHDKKNIFDEEAEKLIDDLPQSIRQEVIYDINMKLLSSHKVFSLQFSKQFQQDLSLCMKILKYGPEINIISQNDKVIQQLYFVLEGNLDINMKLEQKSVSVSILKKGDMFGQIEFFSQKSSQFTVKTLNVVTIAYIEYQDFTNALKNNPQDQEKYYLIKDKINQYSDISALDFQCYGCKRFGHQLFECKSTKYDYKKNRIIQDYMNVSSNSTMERNQQFKRTRQKMKHQQKFTLFDIACQQQEFCSNNEDIICKYYLTYKLFQQENYYGFQDQTFQEIVGDLENIQQQCAPNTFYEVYTGSLQIIEEESKDIHHKKARTTPPKTALKKNFIFLPPPEPKKVSYNVLIQDKNENTIANDEADTSIIGGENVQKQQISKKKIESPKVSFSAFQQLEFYNDLNERLNSTNIKLNQAGVIDKKEDSQLKQLNFANNFMLLGEFDKSKIFKVYFPFNNVDLVLQKYKKCQIKKKGQNNKNNIKYKKHHEKFKFKTNIIN